MVQWGDSESGYRARIILLKDEGYTVPEIRMATNNRHDISTREWIHRFNEKGIDGIASKIRRHRPIRVTAEIEKQVVDTATKNPRECYGLPFSTWSLRTLAGYISKEINLVDTISHTGIRSILIKHGTRHRQSKTTLGNSTDPEHRLKKRGLRIWYSNLPGDCVPLFEDEKGPMVAAKTYGGTSWSSITQSRVSKAQKTRGILNVFGVYDYTNNQIWTHPYKKKTGKQFLDFTKRVDQRYDGSIKQVFLVLDNASIHKSNKVKQDIGKYFPRIQLAYFFQRDRPSST